MKTKQQKVDSGIFFFFFCLGRNKTVEQKGVKVFND